MRRAGARPLLPSRAVEVPMERAEERLFLDFLDRHGGAADAFEPFVAAHPAQDALLRELWHDWRAAAAALAAPVPAGAFAERYEVRGELGKGGMGLVLRVYDRRLERELALKVVRSGAAGSTAEELAARFAAEARITAQLAHPGIVPLHDAGVDGSGRAYYTMPIVAGRTLAELLDQRAKPGPEPGLLDILLRACETMAYAHARGVVHRDLKPANVMVGAFGETYVLDWGIARIRGVPSRAAGGSLPDGSATARTAAGAIVGSAPYMAPEQAAGRADLGPPADVYSAGAILYEILEGTPPYVDPAVPQASREIIELVLAGPPRPPGSRRGAPPELLAICERAMRRDPAQRYAGMAALAADLRAFVELRVVQAYRTGAVAELSKWVRRNRATAAAVVLLLAVVLGAGFALAWRERVAAARERSDSARLLAGEREKLRATAETACASARLSAQRGLWNEALESYDQALALGHPDEVAVRIGRIEAFEGLQRVEESLAELARLQPLARVSHHAAKVLLLEGTLAVDRLSNPDAGLDLVRRAVALGTLDPADRAFAGALLAEDIPAALGCLRAAAEADPSHRQTCEMLGPLLALCGEPEEANEFRIRMRTLFPADPVSILFDYSLLLRSGRTDEAGALLAANEAALGDDLAAIARSLGAAFRVFDQVADQLAQPSLYEPEGLAPGAREWAQVGLGLAGIAASMPSLSAGGEFGVRMRCSVAPQMTRAMRPLLKLRWSVMLDGEFDPAEIEEFADACDEAARIWPECGFLWMAGACHVLLGGPLEGAARVRELALAEASYSSAIAAPAFVPGLRLAARFSLLQAQLYAMRELAETNPAAIVALAARCRQTLLGILRELDHGSVRQYRTVIIAAFQSGQLDLAQAMVEQWRREAPDDRLALAEAARVALWHGAFGPAIQLADRVLAAEPGHELARLVRSEAVAKFGNIGYSWSCEPFEQYLKEHP